MMFTEKYDLKKLCYAYEHMDKILEEKTLNQNGGYYLHITPPFFLTLVLGFAPGKERQIAGVRLAYQARTGACLVTSSFHDRFTPSPVTLLARLQLEKPISQRGISASSRIGSTRADVLSQRNLSCAMVH